MATSRSLLTTLVCAIVFPCLVQAEEQGNTLDAFKSFVEKEHPGKKWSSGPSRLSSREIEKAYPDRQFFYVHSSPPKPPGAALPELIEAHKRRMADFNQNYISVTASVSGGKFTRLTGKPEEYNAGLMKVKTDDDAKLAAAAILTLHPDPEIVPSPVLVIDVKATKTETGWTCSLKSNKTQGTVEFDTNGKCVVVTRSTMVPPPPSAPPRPPAGRYPPDRP